MQIALEYKEWRNFKKVIDKAMAACENSKNTTSDHFVEVNKMATIGSGGVRELGGTMPENLPTPEKSIKQLEREQKKLLKNQ